MIPKTEIVMLASLGVFTYGGVYLLERVGRKDLANALQISVELGAAIYLFNKMFDYIRTVSTMFGL